MINLISTLDFSLLPVSPYQDPLLLPSCLSLLLPLPKNPEKYALWILERDILCPKYACICKVLQKPSDKCFVLFQTRAWWSKFYIRQWIATPRIFASWRSTITFDYSHQISNVSFRYISFFTFILYLYKSCKQTSTI